MPLDKVPLRTNKTELFDTALIIMDKAKDITVDKVKTAQDAMLNLRIDWESLESTLRNRKLDGFEPVVDTMQQLAATTLAMAAVLRAYLMNQRIRQMEMEECDEVAKELAIYRQEKQTKPELKKPQKTGRRSRKTARA